jgi:hypothetical protein
MPFVLDTRCILTLLMISTMQIHVSAGRGSRRKGGAQGPAPTSSTSTTTTSIVSTESTTVNVFMPMYGSAHEFDATNKDGLIVETTHGGTEPLLVADTSTETSTIVSTMQRTTSDTTEAVTVHYEEAFSMTSESPYLYTNTDEPVLITRASAALLDDFAIPPHSDVVTYPRLDVVGLRGSPGDGTDEFMSVEPAFEDVPLSPDSTVSSTPSPWVLDGVAENSEDDFERIDVPPSRKPATKRPPTSAPGNARVIDDDGADKITSKYTRWKASETRGGIGEVVDGHFAAVTVPPADPTLDEEWADDPDIEQIMRMDPACIAAASNPTDSTGGTDVVACAVAMAIKLEESTRQSRRTALNLARDGLVEGAHKLHDGAELVVDSVLELPWRNAARAVIDGTATTAVSLGQTVRAIAGAVAETRLARRTARAVDELVTGASIGAMRFARNVLDSTRSQLEGTVQTLENRITTRENRLNPPPLRGDFVKLADGDEAILVTLKNPKAVVVERPKRRNSQAALGDEDPESGGDSAEDSGDDGDALV